RAGVDIQSLLKRPAQLTTEETTELGKLRALKRGIGVTEALTPKARKALELEKRALKDQVQETVGFEEAAKRAKSGAVSTADVGVDARIAEINETLGRGFTRTEVAEVRLEELETRLARATAAPRDERALLRRELTNALRPRGVADAALQRAITVGPSPIAGVVPGRLAGVTPASVNRVFRQLLANTPADEAGRSLRRLVEEEIGKTGRTAQDLYDSGDWRPGDPSTEAIGEVIGRRPGQAKVLFRPIDEDRHDLRGIGSQQWANAVPPPHAAGLGGNALSKQEVFGWQRLADLELLVGLPADLTAGQ
ncbi:hypothetical protein LCGC14_3167280, partial [marine sediment metagenome]